MQKIVVLNPKGGSGKTTIATNLASYFAVEGLRPTLMDMDAQGSSTHWLGKRSKDQPLIHGIAGFERNTGMTRSFATRLPLDTQRLVVDTPAAVEAQRLPDLTRNATAVLVPVLPSDIDIHAAAKCISNLLLIAKIRRDEHRIAVIANRVKKQTLIYKSLMRFLEKMQIPVVATLRDSQVYIRAAESGLGVFEMKPTQVREDLEQWLPLVGWLARRKPLHVEPGTPAITSLPTTAPKVATVPLESVIPPAPVARPSALQPVAAPLQSMVKTPAAPVPSPIAAAPVQAPVAPATPPRLNPDAVVNALASPASALSSHSSARKSSDLKLGRSESLLPALLRRVFG